MRARWAAKRAAAVPSPEEASANRDSTPGQGAGAEARRFVAFQGSSELIEARLLIEDGLCFLEDSSRFFGRIADRCEP